MSANVADAPSTCARRPTPDIQPSHGHIDREPTLGQLRLMTKFNLASCSKAASRGCLDNWVEQYLSDGPWANPGLRDGLRRQRRDWIGPLHISLERLERSCGPEPSMEYLVSAEAWDRKVARLAAGLHQPEDLPPLIIECRSGTLSIRDGNHRAAAMLNARWTHCWVIVWCNTPSDYESAQAAIADQASQG